MYSTTDKAGKPVWFCIQPDAEFDTYGYYVEVYSDGDGATRVDYFNTYNFDEQQSARIARTRIATEVYIFNSTNNGSYTSTRRLQVRERMRNHSAERD